MHLCGIMLMGLTLVITMVYEVHASEAGQAKVKEYLSKINGDVIVCPVGDSKVVKQMGFGISALPWTKYVIDQATKIFAASGLKLTLRVPTDVPLVGENYTALTWMEQFNFKFRVLQKPDGKPCKNVADINTAVWDWNREWPVLVKDTGMIYQQYKKLLGCDVGVLFISGSEPFLEQSRTGVATRGQYCTDHSHLTLYCIGNADYSAVIVAHEMGHLLGLGHVEHSAMPKGAGSRPTDADGVALYDEVEEQCVTKGSKEDHYVMHITPQYIEGKSAFSKCSLAYLAYNIYRKTPPMRCLPGMN